MVHSACVHLRVLRASAADLRQKLACFATNNTNGPNDRHFSDPHPVMTGVAPKSRSFGRLLSNATTRRSARCRHLVRALDQVVEVALQLLRPEGAAENAA